MSDQTAQHIAWLEEEVARCHKRLEIDVMDKVVPYPDGTELWERIAIPMEDRRDEIDGIECRNDTIRLQDEQIERLRAKRDFYRDTLKSVAATIKTIRTRAPNYSIQENLGRIETLIAASVSE